MNYQISVNRIIEWYCYITTHAITMGGIFDRSLADIMKYIVSTFTQLT